MSASLSTPLLTIKQPRLRPTVAFWAVFAWLAVQGLTLMAAGFRVPFSARFPAPEEQLAMHEMLVAQMVGSALLFPVLMPCFSTAMLVIAAAPIMMLLAGLLASAGESTRLFFACLYPTLWLIGLAMWAYVLRTPKARLYAVACATLLVLGGTMLAYLDREFGSPSQTFDWASHGYLGPLIGGITLLEAGHRTGTIWIFLGAFLLVSLVTASIKWASGRRPPLAH